MSKVVIIGAGRAAWALGVNLQAAGHEVIQIWSRSEANAAALAHKLHTSYTCDLNTIDPAADIYLLSISDDAAAAVAAQIHLTQGVIAHTSGISPVEILSSCGVPYGVFYPFVSMSREVQPDFTQVTVLVESPDPDCLDILTTLAQSLSDHVRPVEATQRMHLHLAAVFAHNFTNHLIHIAEILLQQHGMRLDDIRPLLHQHAKALETHSPEVLQTGVAIRGDTRAMERHLSLLESHPDFKAIYALLSSSIKDIYHLDT